MKKNYYSIHKNKKKRKSISRIDKKSLRIIKRALCKASKLVQTFIEIYQYIKPIPNYKKGGVKAVVGAYFSNGRDYSAESIILPNGAVKVLSPDQKIYKGEGKYIIEGIGEIQSPQDFSKSKSIEMFRQMVASGDLNLNSKSD